MGTLTLSNELMENKPVRIVAISLLLALLSGCGSSMSARSSASTGGPAGSGLVELGVGEAQCSMFDSTSTRLGGKVTTYYMNSVLQEDKARVRITSLAEAFDTNTNVYIQAYRWRINGSGTAEIDNTPVQFTFENGSGSDVALTTPLTSVSARDITGIRAVKGISATSSVDFFSKTTMVVSQVDYTWQALKLVIYDGTTTPPTIVGSSDILLPIFQANPNKYAIGRSPTLVALHPFVSQVASTSTTEADWAARAASFCF